MNDPTELLIGELIEWIGRAGRTYADTMEAWRTSCPRLPVWEEANDRGLVTRIVVDGQAMVCVTSKGEGYLKSRDRYATQRAGKTSLTWRL